MSADDTLNKKIADLQQRLVELDRERTSVLTALEQLQQRRWAEVQPTPSSQTEDKTARTPGLSNAEKIALFRSLFRGRDDVFPRRWENAKNARAGYAPACHNEWVRGICEKPRIKCSNCPNQAFVPVSDEVVRSHLQGRDVANPGKIEPFIAGVYPLMIGETCWFLAADFDKQSWKRDALAFLTTCREKGVPAALERSRSGNGGHVWIFFSEPIPASEARKLGAHLVTETMDRCPDVGFESYDRFFPSQDTMPLGGFGNLIALPLQNGPRQQGNSVFVDDDLRSYDDQWAFLANLSRMSRSEVVSLVDQASAAGRIVGVRLPLDDDEDEPWLTPPSRRKSEQPISGVMPERVEVVLANQVYINRIALPPSLVNRLIRLAAFQNPEFYAAQAMRLPTFGKPRVISCAELLTKHVALPRGCVDAAVDLLTSNGIRADLRDERHTGKPLGACFLGTLTTDQQAAVDALMAHDTGVLAATTAFGKTVIACNLIAKRNTNTLILVHRQQLLDQWVTQLRAFLDVAADRVGMIRGGRKRPTGIIDVATVQSLVRKREVSDFVAEYGHLVVDECHHLSAVSFEAVARAAKADAYPKHFRARALPELRNSPGRRDATLTDFDEMVTHYITSSSRKTQPTEVRPSGVSNPSFRAIGKTATIHTAREAPRNLGRFAASPAPANTSAGQPATGQEYREATMRTHFTRAIEDRTAAPTFRGHQPADRGARAGMPMRLGQAALVAVASILCTIVGAAGAQGVDRPHGSWCQDPLAVQNNTIQPAPPAKLSDFALYADRSVHMEHKNLVAGGDVGVRLAAISQFGPQLLIKGDAKIQKQLWSPSITLGPQVTTGGIVADKLQPPGPMEGFPASTMPALPLLPAPPVGGQPVTVAAGKTVQLPPGNYGALSVQKGGALVLSPGSYSFISATLDDSSRLVAELGNVKVGILGRLTVQQEVEIYPAAPNGKMGTADHLTLSVYGADDVESPSAVVASAQKTAVYIGPKSRIRALLTAPHGTLWFDQDVLATGAFAAFDIVLQDGVAVALDHGFADSPDVPRLQQLHGYVPAPGTCASLLMEPVPQSLPIRVSISLPVRMATQLQAFLRQVSDPKSSSFRQFLTPSQFNATYGGTAADYNALKNWVTSNGFSIVATYPDNLFLSVTATVAQFEQALHVYLVYRQRADGSPWISVDREPAISLQVPILHISGLTTAVLPTPAAPTTTGNGGAFRGTDIRNAYLGSMSSCMPLTGAGQTVAILSFDNFNPADISSFAARQSPPINSPNVQLVAVEGGNPIGPRGLEVTMDIEMVLSMAPQAQVLVFQGNSGITAHLDNILKTMANFATPLTVASNSLVFAQSDTAQQALDQMAAQGTSFISASGDYGDVGDPQNYARMNNQTLVGGTILTTNALTPATSSAPPIYPPNYYQGETVWNFNQSKQKDASGGGIMNGSNNGPGGYCVAFCSPVSIPAYQVGVSMATNGGSTGFRNYPDVAMIAVNVEVFYDSGVITSGGTSASAPLWAGLTALINQQRSMQPGSTGQGMGFLNPTIYDIGLTRGTAADLYRLAFNDIASGNNANGYGAGFSAVPGYDLATGWGSPKCALVSQLGSNLPLTATTALPLIRFVIGTGGDNLRGKGGFASGCGATGATATIFLPDGSNFTVTLKDPNDPAGWENNTTTAPLDFPVPNTGQPLTMANGIAGMNISIQENFSGPCSPDNWDMTTLSVSLFHPLNPAQQVCQINITGTDTLEDGHVGIIRLSQTQGNSGFGPTSPTFLAGTGCQ